MSHQDAARDTRILRTAADTAALLLELERGLKAFLYYPPDSAERGDLLDRCYRAWSDDLGRFGPLALEVRGSSFWYGVPPIPVGSGRCEDLARQFHLRSIGQLVFDPSLHIQGLATLLEALATPPMSLVQVGLPGADEIPGIHIPDPEPGGTDRANSPARHPCPEPLHERSGSDDTAPQLDVDPETIDPETTLTGAPSPLVSESPASPASPPRLEIDNLLDELEDCEDDEGYREIGFQLAAVISERVNNGFCDEGYNALLVFARHASDDQKRSVEQRYVAENVVNRLCEGPLLELVIDRACSPQADAALRASETLLVLGAASVPPLLERLARERDRVTRSRLTGVILAMGEEAANALLPELEGADPARRRVALRLAGETQNPRLVPPLRRIFLQSGADAARESAKSLVQIGDVAAYEALVEGLHNQRPEVVRLATYSLGRTGRSLFVAPLVAVLQRALDDDEFDLGREAVRALGRLGQPEAVSELSAVLSQGGFFRRGRLRELKLSTIAALRALPGEAADRVLRRALRLRDRVLRDAARSALIHRGSEPR